MTRGLKLCGALLCVLLAGVLSGGCVSVNLRYPTAGSRVSREPVTTVEYTVPPYTAVRVRANVELVYSNAPDNTVRVETGADLVEYLEISVEDGTLVIDADQMLKTLQNKDPVVYLSNPDLTRLEFLGGVVMREADTIAAEELVIDVVGACVLDLDLQVDRLSLSMSGAGTITMAGTADTMEVIVAGVGSIDAEDLAAREGAVNMSGVGTVDLNCSERLSANVSGAGTVTYAGDPEVNANVSLVGTLARRD